MRDLSKHILHSPREDLLAFSKAIPVWIKDKLFQKSAIIKKLKLTIDKNVNWQDLILFSEHHLSHAASAFYPSPFERAAVLTLDGVGEWTTTSLAIGKGNNLKVIKEIHFPHSLGLLYSAFTYYTGFKVNSGEYKVMGLAPYGEPRYADIIKDKLIKVSEDGSFQLNMNYFDYATGLTMTNEKFNELFGGPPRTPETELSQRDMDLTASVQKVTDVVLKIAKEIVKETGERNLCLAGGVALNCVANGVLLREKIFDKIWIQPAAGDAGGALGAALSIWYLHYNNHRVVPKGGDAMQGGYLGPKYSNREIEDELTACGAVFKKCTEIELIDKVVGALVEEKAVGWMQGHGIWTKSFRWTKHNC